VCCPESPAEGRARRACRRPARRLPAAGWPVATLAEHGLPILCVDARSVSLSFPATTSLTSKGVAPAQLPARYRAFVAVGDASYVLSTDRASDAGDRPYHALTVLLHLVAPRSQPRSVTFPLCV